MARLALVEGGIVANTFEGDPAEHPGAVVMGANGVPEMSRGDGWDGATHTVPAPDQEPKTWDLLQLYRELTLEERVGILAASATDPVAGSFLRMADATIQSGARLRADDPDLIAGFAYLVSAGLLTAARRDAILGA